MKALILFLCCLGSACAQPFAEWVPTNDLTPFEFDNMDVKVGVDGKCNAVAVWVNQEMQVGNRVIEGATLAFGSDTWASTSTIAQANVDLIQPLIEVEPQGDAVILYSNTSSDLFGARLPAGSSTWMGTTPAPIDTNVGGGAYSLAMNGSGDAIAAWQVDVTTIRAARLAAGSTAWDFTTDVIAVGTNSFPIVDINDCGDAVVIWTGFDNGNPALLGARLAAGLDDWELTGPAFVGSFASGIEAYDVALDDSGRAIAVFSNNGTIRGAKLPKGMLTWQATSALSQGMMDVFPKVRVDGPRCIAVAIWEMAASPFRERKPKAFQQTIEGAVLPFDELDWVPTTDLSSGTAATQARLAMDEFGNAIAVWNAGSMLIQGAVLDAGSTTWEQTNDLAMAPGLDQVFLPDVEVSPNGLLAVGAWTALQNGTSDEKIQAATNRMPFTPQPPGLIFGEQIKNYFSSQSECVNRIFWTPSPSVEVVFYRVFRNGALIGTVSAKKNLVFEDHNQSKGQKVYEVAAVGLNGKESARVSVTVP